MPKREMEGDGAWISGRLSNGGTGLTGTGSGGIPLRNTVRLKEEHKELLFQCAVRQYSSTRIAAIRGQTDRNIRKIRNTMLKKIRKKLLAALAEKSEKQQGLTLLEKIFLEENGIPVDTV